MNKMADEKKEKLKALQVTLDKLDKTYGKGTIMKLGDSKIMAVRSNTNRLVGIRHCPGYRRLAQRQGG